MKKLLILALCVFIVGTVQADTYNVQKTWATGETITAPNLNSDDQELARILNGNLDSTNLKDGTVRNVDWDAAYPLDLSNSAGTSTTETLQDCLENDGTNDSLGWKQGLSMERSSTTKLIVHAGSIAIGSNLYSEASTVTVTLATAWSGSSTTGGKDSGTTYNDGDLIYVFACVTTGDPDGIAYNLSENAVPTDVTPGSNARCVGAFEYDSTNGVQQVIHYEPWGISGWDFFPGDDTNGAVKAITHGVTFYHAPSVAICAGGSQAVATEPVDIDAFAGSEEGWMSVYAITPTVINAYMTLVDNNHTDSGKNYLVLYTIYGQWTL